MLNDLKSSFLISLSCLLLILTFISCFTFCLLVSFIPCQGGILFSEQAGSRSILRLNLHRGKAVRPLEHNTLHNSFFQNPGRVDWLTVYRLMDLCCAYADKVVFREAACCNVVLQELLGKVLVHLSCLVDFHGVSTSLVQICWEKIILKTDDHSCSFMFNNFES